MVERLIVFLKGCPQLKDRLIACGYLGEFPGCCSLEMGKRVYESKRYADGGRLMKRHFVLALREIYSADNEENKRVAKLGTDIERWLSEMNRSGVLPDLSGFGTAVSISIVNGFRLMTAESLDARYEAEFEVEWFEEGK